MASSNGGNAALTQRIQNGNQQPANNPAKTIEAYMRKMAPTFAEVLPKHVDQDRMFRVALTTIRTNPKLLQCDVSSLMAAVMQASMLGLEPGLLGHCYMVPYGNQVTMIIGYKGMIDLARRSGNIQSISAHEVYENDYLELTYGLEENLKHIPWHIRSDIPQTESGRFRGCYMVAKFNDGGHYIHYMPEAEIEQHKHRSKTWNNGPWKTDYIEMAKKTVVRSAWKWLPISIEIASQVAESDETTRKDVTAEPDFIDLPPLDDAQNESAATTEPEGGVQSGFLADA